MDKKNKNWEETEIRPWYYLPFNEYEQEEEEARVWIFKNEENEKVEYMLFGRNKQKPKGKEAEVSSNSAIVCLLLFVFEIKNGK